MGYPAKLKPANVLRASCLNLALAMTASATPVAPLWYSSAVDTVSGIASFSIRFDRAPDLVTHDEYGRQADSFQYWTDSEAPDAEMRTYAAYRGDLPFGTQTVISTREIPTLNQMEIIWPQPWDWPHPRDPGGWGSVEGHSSYTLSADNVLSFQVPLSLLHDDDGKFFYTFELGDWGAWTGVSYQGVSGEFYAVSAVPEPSKMLMLCTGLVALLAAVRRSGGAGLAAPAAALPA